MSNRKEYILHSIKETVAQVMPTGAKVILLGLRLEEMLVKILIGTF